MYLTKSETLLSSFKAFQRLFVKSSILPVTVTFTGSPSKLGSGLPSPR